MAATYSNREGLSCQKYIEQMPMREVLIQGRAGLEAIGANAGQALLATREVSLRSVKLRARELGLSLNGMSARLRVAGANCTGVPGVS